MSSSRSIDRQRKNDVPLITLAPGQSAPTEQEIRAAVPGASDPKFWIAEITRIIDDRLRHSVLPYVKSNTDVDDESLERALESMMGRLQDSLGRAAFEFTRVVRDQNPDSEKPAHDFFLQVNVANAEAVLKAIEPSLSETDTLFRVADWLNVIKKEIALVRESLRRGKEHEARDLQWKETLETEIAGTEKTIGKDRKSKNALAGLRGRLTELSKRIQQSESGQASDAARIIALEAKRLAVIGKVKQALISGVPDEPFFRIIEQEILKLEGLDLGYQLQAPLFQSRQFRFQTFSPDLEAARVKNEEVERRKSARRRWIPRAAVLLTLAGGGAFYARSRVQDNLGQGGQTGGVASENPSTRSGLKKFISRCWPAHRAR